MTQTDLKFSPNITPSLYLPFARPPNNLVFSIAITTTLGTLPSHCQLPNIRANFALHSVFRVQVGPRGNMSCYKPDFL